MSFRIEQTSGTAPSEQTQVVSSGKGPQFSDEELQGRRIKFCKTYNVPEDSRLLVGAHETSGSKALENPIYFSNFPDGVGFLLEGKVEYSAANPGKIFTSLGETYRRVEVECFLNGAAVHVEVPIGSYDSSATMKEEVGDTIQQFDAFLANGDLNKLAELSDGERRVIVIGGSYGGCSAALYPASLIREKGPLTRKLYMARREDVKVLEGFCLNEIPFEELSK
jgi:hypothetical protein